MTAKSAFASPSSPTPPVRGRAAPSRSGTGSTGSTRAGSSGSRAWSSSPNRPRTRPSGASPPRSLPMPTPGSRASTGCRSTPASAPTWPAAATPAARSSRLAVHADRRHGRKLLRGLRVRNFAGEMLDDPETIAAAAAEAGDRRRDRGLDAGPRGRAGARARRMPTPAARCPRRGSSTTSSPTGRAAVRYTCPSYEITRLEDGVTISVPGFQPFAVYDAILANLVPGLERREPPELRRRGPRAGARSRSRPRRSRSSATSRSTQAREELGRVAAQDCVGADGFWHLEDEA